MTKNLRSSSWVFFAGALLVACAGCANPPGVPAAGADVARPDQQLDFHVLYKQNCAGCHGDNGRGGAALPLNNPAYLAIVGAQNLRTLTAQGMKGSMMPAFAQGSGGMLTDAQVDALVQGMLREWGRASDFPAATLPSYSSTTPGDTNSGQKVYATACARCHGADGAGIKTQGQSTPQHSIVDASYLTLVSDQSLRTAVIAGHLDDNAPDWRSYIPGRALAPQEITDIVAWLASHRPSTAQTSAVANPPAAATGAASSNSAPHRTAASNPATTSPATKENQ
jgi:cytochrome c oxidase cbb3-type subunit 3